ncbi:MAG: Rrf2 family transcriptional regulator [Lachnospiraceae bacterium]|nr:Rrf2 family transcriptional regulator [Lachnospiraceae bacterium]
MDTRFSSAIHTLILISEAETPMTSEEIAKSVGTNASYIRKVTSLLKRKGIIESRRGVSGFQLLISPRKLLLYDIYLAVSETDQVHVFDLHQNPNDQCIVGKHIRPVLLEVFRSVEEKAEQELKNTTLADCIDRMRNQAEGSDDK